MRHCSAWALPEPAVDSNSEPPAEGGLDPELAALLGDSLPADSATDDLAASDSLSDDLQPSDDLAPSDSEPDFSAAPVADMEPPSEFPSQPNEISPFATEPEPTMSTITDDLPDLEPENEAVPAARSASIMTEDLDTLIAQAQAATNYGGGAPPVIDFQSLLEPISDNEPAGGGVPYDVRERLEQMRKEINPEAFAADDPLRPTDLVKADWTGIIALAQETLRGTSKNLLVAARLVEALTKKHGFVGLRDGLHLMRLMAEICWDRLDPPLEDEDMEVRAAPFNWLDDPDRGAYFPNSIRSVTLLAADGNQFSWLQWQQSQSGSEGSEKVERTITTAPRDRCQALVDALAQTRLEIKHLMSYLTDKMGSEARPHGASPGRRRLF